jgi:hypothetical protein
MKQYKANDPMLVEPYNANEMRMARVEQLAELYRRYEGQEINVMELPEASIELFREQYKG